MYKALSDAFKLEESREIISFVGAGGKSTTMFKLAEELKSKDKKVLISTTTAIYNPIDNYDYYFLRDVGEKFLPENGTITILGESVLDSKLRGVSRDKLDEIYRSNIFDFILVEADGSKRKSIKAPREGEPIIPKSTTKTIGLIGMGCLGENINDENVHRSDLFLKITDKSPGDIIEEMDIIKLVLHPNGLFKDSLGEEILILNKCTEDKLEILKDIKKKLIKKQFKAILIANINKKEFY